MKKKKQRFVSGLLLVMLTGAVVFSGCTKKPNSNVDEVLSSLHAEETTAVETTSAVIETTTEEPTTEAPITISLVAIGDMLMHYGVSYRAEWSGTWDYSYLFTYTKDAIAAADISIVNNESIMGGNDLGNISYPCFNVRTELGDAEVATGFDVVLSATNHCLDQGINGLMNCVNFWKTAHPDTTLLGIHDTAEDADLIHVVDVNGIKLALLNYTYGLNGFSLPEGQEYAVDLMTEDTKTKIADDLARAKQAADFVIVFPHWGTEYQLSETAEQQSWAQFFADNGADLVIGTHPHVVEPVKWITAADGHQMLCYYSLGNYTSLQPYTYSLLGGMAQVSITKDTTGTYVSDYGIRYLVTQYDGQWVVEDIYYLDDYTDDLAAAHTWTVVDGSAEVNAMYPFTVAGLKSLAESITPDLVDY